MIAPETKTKIIRYVRWGSVLLAFIVAMFFYEKPYEQQGAKEIVGAISNCFITPGVVFSGIGILSYISKKGGYDSFGYVFSNFSLHHILFNTPKVKYESLYDYKVAKDEKGRKWLPEMLFTGLGAFSVGVVIFVIYLIL